MRVATLNTNGIRAAARKGFFDWMPEQDLDVLCLQEVRAQPDQRSAPVFSPPGFHAYFSDAEKKGYSGVAIYTRHEPENVVYGFGWEDFDTEGRYVQLDFDAFSIGSIYLPSGTSGDVRQSFKYDVMDRLKPVLREFADSGRDYLLCGDWNIAHRQIDLKNWRSNQKNSGFLPDERAWMDWLFGDAGYVDVFRSLDPREEQYTWWSNRGQAWANNVGWRIDYQVATPGFANHARSASIYREQRFSDHAPLIIEYEAGLE